MGTRSAIRLEKTQVVLPILGVAVVLPGTRLPGRTHRASIARTAVPLSGARGRVPLAKLQTYDAVEVQVGLCNWADGDEARQPIAFTADATVARNCRQLRFRLGLGTFASTVVSPRPAPSATQ